MRVKEEKDDGYPALHYDPMAFGRSRDEAEEVDLDREQDYGHDFDKEVFRREDSSRVTVTSAMDNAMEKDAASTSNSPVMGYRRSLADSTTIDADLVRKFVKECNNSDFSFLKLEC